MSTTEVREPSKVEKQLSEMFALQDTMNSVVNKDWKNAGYRWVDAIMVEATEAFNHTAWEWWKNTEADADWDQVRMEIVDIWHFLLAKMIQEGWIGNVAGLALVVNSYASNPPTEAKEPFQAAIKDVIFESTVDRLSSTGRILHVLMAAMAYSGLSFERLYNLYVAKNVLNIFRQDHGYKGGTYIKTWYGKEDNEVLTGIVQSTFGLGGKELSFDALYAELEKAYPEGDKK
jgi:dimeric dUTPase (all-alpha-NTP-PPase superfamily)